MQIQTSLNRRFIFLFFSTFAVFAGCKKETSATNSLEEKNFAEFSSISNIEAFAVFDDVYNNVMGVNDEVAFGQTGVFGRIITNDS